jgi:hypothetical protein
VSLKRQLLYPNEVLDPCSLTTDVGAEVVMILLVLQVIQPRWDNAGTIFPGRQE